MTRITRNLNEGETLSFDKGRIVFTMLRRSGRMARIAVDVRPDVLVDKPTTEKRETPMAEGLADGEARA